MHQNQSSVGENAPFVSDRLHRIHPALTEFLSFLVSSIWFSRFFLPCTYNIMPAHSWTNAAVLMVLSGVTQVNCRHLNPPRRYPVSRYLRGTYEKRPARADPCCSFGDIVLRKKHTSKTWPRSSMPLDRSLTRAVAGSFSFCGSGSA